MPAVETATERQKRIAAEAAGQRITQQVGISALKSIANLSVYRNFRPGGALHSPTTETQWYDGLSTPTAVTPNCKRKPLNLVVSPVALVTPHHKRKLRIADDRPDDRPVKLSRLTILLSDLAKVCARERELEVEIQAQVLSICGEQGGTSTVTPGSPDAEPTTPARNNFMPDLTITPVYNSITPVQKLSLSLCHPNGSPVLSSSYGDELYHGYNQMDTKRIEATEARYSRKDARREAAREFVPDSPPHQDHIKGDEKKQADNFSDVQEIGAYETDGGNMRKGHELAASEGGYEGEGKDEGGFAGEQVHSTGSGVDDEYSEEGGYEPGYETQMGRVLVTGLGGTPPEWCKYGKRKDYKSYN
ncbi:hypothetical protein M422DRAFT_266716 [Sphaerobolus stellatus SS14]|uniref:Uncharacterized protein n=1 Tax=Sphaerobolus stellatus (strain SS14) TaxID=990650 RepID=A0A0C9V256_SPHS4|nr:hypothetical protein M422DRAFT_266716 [Sphaerobolus stellatus SS14]